MPISILLAIFIKKYRRFFNVYVFNNHNFEESNCDPVCIHSYYLCPLGTYNFVEWENIDNTNGVYLHFVFRDLRLRN